MNIEEIGAFVLAAIVVILVVVFSIRDCSRQEKCADDGGRVERYNYRTIYVAQSCGSGCTIMVPQTVSDWRCVDLPAERR